MLKQFLGYEQLWLGWRWEVTLNKTMIYANLQNYPNSTINLIPIPIWPGREMRWKKSVWGKEVGCKAGARTGVWIHRAPRQRRVSVRETEMVFCQVSGRLGYSTVEGWRLDWDICSVNAKAMTCFRLTSEMMPHLASEPPFALGLNCKAGEKISLSVGVGAGICHCQ